MNGRTRRVRPAACRRGFILPLVLLATLAITALAVAAFTLAQAEHRVTEWERSWVGTVAGAGEGGGSAEGGGAPVATALSALGHGYHLVAVGDTSLLPLLRHEVWWCMDPRAEAAGPWTEGDHPPRLGPLDPARLLELLGVEGITEAGTAFVVGGAPEDPVRLVAVEAGRLRVLQEDGVVLVVAEGSVLLEGPGTVRGIFVVGGELERRDGVEIVGGVRAGSLAGSPPEGGSEGPAPLDEGFAPRATALGLLPPCPLMVQAVGRLGYF